jgi:PKD repeat protein
MKAKVCKNLALILLALIFLTAILTPVQASSKTVTIYVDTSAIDARSDLTKEQKNDLKNKILEDIKSNFEKAVGKDNVIVTNDPKKKKEADRIVNIKPGNSTPPGSAWGSWEHGSSTVDVYLGEFMDDKSVADNFKTNGKWDTTKLGKAIGHTAGHELGHSYSIGHNGQTGAKRSKMTKGSNIPASDRATTDFDFDKHSVDVLKKNWKKKPCKTAQDYDQKVLITHYWEEPFLPHKPNELGSVDALFSFEGTLSQFFEFGVLGEDTDGGAEDGNSDFDFIYKSSMFGNETDAEMITFIMGAHNHTQFVLRGREGTEYAGRWFILNESNVVLDDFVTTPYGVNISHVVLMMWDIDGIPGMDVVVMLDSLAYGENSSLFNGFTYELLFPPVANFSYYPSPPFAGDLITFNASPSNDPDGDIVSYEWDFGDGESAVGEIVQHSYLSKGSYNVTLTVRDNDGIKETKTVPIQIHATCSVHVAPVSPAVLGSNFSVSIMAYNVTNLTAFNLFLKYNVSSIEFVGWNIGSDVAGLNIFYSITSDGVVEISAASFPPLTYNGDLEIATLTFRANNPGVSEITFDPESRVMFFDGANVTPMIGVSFTGAWINVTAAQPGDIDADSDVDFNDLIGVLNLILTGGYNPAGDIDGDGDIDFNDLIGVLNLILR